MPDASKPSRTKRSLLHGLDAHSVDFRDHSDRRLRNIWYHCEVLRLIGALEDWPDELKDIEGYYCKKGGAAFKTTLLAELGRCDLDREACVTLMRKFADEDWIVKDAIELLGTMRRRPDEIE